MLPVYLYSSLVLCCVISADLSDPEKGHLRSEREVDLIAMLKKLVFPLKDTNYYFEVFNKGLKSLNDKEVVSNLEWASLNKLSPEDVKAWKSEGFTEGKRKLPEIYETGEKLVKSGVTVPRDEAAFRHQIGFQLTSNISIEMIKNGLVMEIATQNFKERSGITNRAITGLPTLKAVDDCMTEQEDMLLAPFQKNLTCDPLYQYRSIDGSCNNLGNILQGAAFRKYRRALFPDYADGVSAPRHDSSGLPLPSARLVSSTISRLPNEESLDISMLHMSYGQFLDHDFTSTPITKIPSTVTSFFGNQPISCCDPRYLGFAGLFGNQLGCFPIDIPEDDPFYSLYDQRCMEFKRSAPAPSCLLGPREQINELSAYIEGSMIYGVKPPINGSDSFREMKDGLLTLQEGDLLPPLTVLDMNACNTPEKMAMGQFCFRAGDGRLNENIGLVFVHTVWTREHNRIAKILKVFHPQYDDEKLYQETRHIVAAQIQHVTYNEFLPTLIPHSLMEKDGLHVKTGSTQTSHYDPSIDVSIANSFAAATYRFGHSQVGDFHHRINEYGTVETLESSSTFFNPFFFYEKNSVGSLARGALLSRSGKADAFFTEEVSGKLFHRSKPFGLDLPALNIQRGREHGIPGYVKWLEYCGMDATSFDELKSVMANESVVALQSIYSNVGDIDLFAGALSEMPVPNGFLGFTFTCLLTDQFKRLKFGDRFWYEEANQAGSFTPAQMEQVHNITLARIMCNTIPELMTVPRYPLRNPRPDNPMIPCDCADLPVYDLSPWGP
ncbi:hypothetical protein SK128_017554 [Halocaridina rubra]|uniref:Peroxidase n=1 Tax=Halocaridina rubra TaxID=373956 RepID=A0AAN8WLS6_HALRR